MISPLIVVEEGHTSSVMCKFFYDFCFMLLPFPLCWTEERIWFFLPCDFIFLEFVNNCLLWFAMSHIQRFGPTQLIFKTTT